MEGSTTPRVSILIPNYNNGRQSSRSGDHDLIADLLNSLEQTLRDDPTPFEIIAYDDGSTDDSLPTLRAWSQRTWPDGRPFLTLIEQPHCGILARTANVLSRRARGEILARLDGDVVCLTPNWVTRLARLFDDAPPRLGVVGPKQLRLDGKIHALGDWILHPNGYTHIASGLDRHAVRYPIEADHVMGAFYCCRRALFDDLGGYDEDYLRGQTVDFGLRARLNGWSCIAVPHIEYLHNHGLRTRRSTSADSHQGVADSIDLFERKWGFNRLAPDLELVAQRYKGTPLLWNARWFAGLDQPRDDGLPLPTDQPPRIDTSPWGRYAHDPAFRQHVDFRVAVALDLIRRTGNPKEPVLLDNTCGLIAHVLALKRLPCKNIILDRPSFALAQQCTRNHTYPAARPLFAHEPTQRGLPLADHACDLILLFDQLERHPNPVGLLKEASRALKPDALMALVSQTNNPADDLATGQEHRYRQPQLLAQIEALHTWDVLADPNCNNPQQDTYFILKNKLHDATITAKPVAETNSTPTPSTPPRPITT